MRTAAWTATAVLLLAGCATPGPADVLLRPVPDAAAGEQVALFSVDDVLEDVYHFGIDQAFPLPDGTVLLSYDVAADSAGDETATRPRLAVLGADGVLESIERPGLEGGPVSQIGRLLAVGADGTAYFSERGATAGRLVARSLGGEWRAVPATLTTEFSGPTAAAVGPDGQLYVTDDVGLHRVTRDGRQDLVFRVDRLTGSEHPGAPPLRADQPPVPAADVVLSDVWSLAVGLDGTTFAANRHEIVAVDPGGTLRLVTTTAGLQAALGIVSTLDPPFVWSRLAVDADGSLLVSDHYQQLVADLDGPTIVARNAYVAGSGLDASRSAHGDLLLRLLDPDALEAGEQRPDVLAAYGR